MNTLASRIPRQTPLANAPVQRRSAFRKEGPDAVVQCRLQHLANGFSQQQPIQRVGNKTGLPDNLKSGIENLSGYSMDDVKVHYNSDKPAGLQAHAYAQGSDIHVAPGQEKHLPHEAWHVVQQKQGRVKATRQLKGVAVNDNTGLEREADEMGAKAQQTPSVPAAQLKHASADAVVQRKSYDTLSAFFAAEMPHVKPRKVHEELRLNIDEAKAQLPFVDFLKKDEKRLEVDPRIVREDRKFTIVFDPDIALDPDLIYAYMIHELIHIANVRKYDKNNEHISPVGNFINLHLPEKEEGEAIERDGQWQGFSETQIGAVGRQLRQLGRNWDRLLLLLESEDDIPKQYSDHLKERISYASKNKQDETDTVLFDIVYYMEVNKLRHTDTYDLALAMLKEARIRRNALPGGENREVQNVPQAPRKSSWSKAFTHFVDNWPPSII